jgi:hypothetical protein
MSQAPGIVNHAECFAKHVPTGLTKGDQRREGRYFRCLQAGDVTQLFRHDTDGAEYGHRVRPDKWRWKDSDQEQGLSVTEAECARTAACAVYLHSSPEDFEHVVRIDLQALSEALGLSLVAVFDPVEDEPANPCHFVIMPTEVQVEDLLIQLPYFMADQFPPVRPGAQPPKKPRKPEDISKIREARARYDLVFQIVRNVKSLQFQSEDPSSTSK